MLLQRAARSGFASSKRPSGSACGACTGSRGLFEMCGPAWPEVTSGAAIATAAHQRKVRVAADRSMAASTKGAARPGGGGGDQPGEPKWGLRAQKKNNTIHMYSLCRWRGESVCKPRACFLLPVNCRGLYEYISLYVRSQSCRNRLGTGIHCDSPKPNQSQLLHVRLLHVQL